MFTGIIEELGTLERIERGSVSAHLNIRVREILKEVRLGDSISVNGVCLTVTDFASDRFTADVMGETLAKTNLGNLRIGDRVNLERALRMGDRLGGHLVSGHIDGVGTIVDKAPHGIAQVFTVEAPDVVMRYVIRKGSLAIDGISLTVVDCTDRSFRVSIIPHTAKMTTLGFKKKGDSVNLEADMLARYVEKLLQGREPKADGSGKLDNTFLSKHGFL
ncbi:MAG: riboflavin synthase [Clostridia bacterium]|nr:riboflavin synthase [Clostridia bacterium]MDQ7791126.1 riboflavin synthase [Clostridia bacterium]